MTAWENERDIPDPVLSALAGKIGSPLASAASGGAVGEGVSVGGAVGCNVDVLTGVGLTVLVGVFDGGATVPQAVSASRRSKP